MSLSFQHPPRILSLLPLLLSSAVLSQQPSATVATAPPTTSVSSADVVPNANPSRPTVTSPATLPPVGYLQFEQGVNFATDSPGGIAQQGSVLQTTRLSLTPRLSAALLTEPFGNSRLLPEATGTPQPASSQDTGDLILGLQGVVAPGSGRRPTVSLGYNRRVRAGSLPDLDIGGNGQLAVILVSGDLRSFHYDTNFAVAEQQGLEKINPVPLRRAQYLQTLSVSHDLTAHALGHDLGLSGELWHATQPLAGTTRHGTPNLRSNAVGLLLALGYTLRPNLVLDAGFDHGLTSTSTDWQGFAGFTYLLPHRLWPR